MKPITLLELMRTGKERLFRFPIPGEKDDIWRLLLIYSKEGLGAKIRNTRTGEVMFCSASELVIPVVEKQSEKKEEIKFRIPQEIPIGSILSRPVSPWLYVLLIILLCLVIYLYAFAKFV